MVISKDVAFAIFLILFSNFIESLPQINGDKQGKTALMNYVIAQQVSIDKKWDEIYALWHRCFYLSSKLDFRKKDDLLYSYGETVHPMNPFPMKDFEILQAHEQEMKILLSTTLDTIVLMIKNGADVYAQDKDGKTVFDYCVKAHIYNVLQSTQQ